MKYNNFLELLGNPEPICFVDNHAKISVSDIPKYIDNHDIYFIPNIGGTKTDDIREFKTFFVDLDAGRDTDGNYLPGKMIKQFKAKQWEKINNFSIPPNAVIGTRNGLHLYWFIKETISKDLWQSIENALINHFNGDKRVCTPAHQMRMPDTYWRKDPMHPYYCRLLKYDDVYINIASYCKEFNISACSASKNKMKFQYAKQKAPKNKSISPRVFTNYKQVFDYLTKEVSMFDYLHRHYGIDGTNPRSFKCIIHDDKHPSASIFKVDSGVELYCCNASNCGFKGNIIQIVSYLEKCPRSEAILKICKDINVEYKVDKRLESILRDNINTIKDDIKYSHTDLYSAIYRYTPTLRELHDIAIDSLEYSHSEGKFLFTSSIQYIAQRLGRHDKKNTTADIGFLCLLKLIEKVDLDAGSNEVPKEYEKYVRNFQGDKNNYITVFSIPSYTYTVLTECQDVAKQVKEKGLRKTHFSYETVANAFDKETADRVFPQIKGKAVKNIDAFLLQTLNILIDRDGYFTLNTVKCFYSDNGVVFREKTYIRQLPAIVKRLQLKKIKATKKIKEEYTILSAGYPYIFIKKR